LMAAVKAGVGRETAHQAIRRHALDVAAQVREQGTEHNDLLDRLAADPVLHAERATIEQTIRRPLEFTGVAAAQIANVADRIEKLAAEYPDAAAYDPEPIL
jgi:adenylosuccinate lyase